jgi:hypothetical protein
MTPSSTSTIAICSWLLAALQSVLLPDIAAAAQIDIVGPTGSDEFGRQVLLLPNGNFVVTDPFFDEPGGAADVGAVHLYQRDGVLMYTLRGSSTGDQVGNAGITVLSNGHFIVLSPNWDNSGIFDAGAATWCNGVSGSNAVVNAGNSLVGGTAGNLVGNFGAYALTNGNYVVVSPEWDSSTVIDVGAVTWGNGATGSSGVVGASNSLVGSSSDDRVGFGTLVALSNGNYAVSSRYWDNGAAVDAGAATWGNGATGTSGVVGVGNSLVGTAAGDAVGGCGVYALVNGHYVVGSCNWDNGSTVDVGAVTWGNGNSGSSGIVSASNSLIGTTPNDVVGQGSVYTLNNGHYVVSSYMWDNAGVIDAGAVTWRDGNSSSPAVVSAGNSLVGTTFDDLVGIGGVTPLSNGHYVVGSYHWDNGSIEDAGAATWRDGSSGVGGVVSGSNSLVGSTAFDRVGIDATALSNGHYVVNSWAWNNGGIADVGAATWRNGNSGSGATVSASNSLIGSTANDRVGISSTEALRNGHYVVLSPYWSNGAIGLVGATTWRDGNSSSGATVSASNSLIGSNAGDRVGNSDIAALSNGHYAVGSGDWHNGAIADAGAVTWRNGTGSSGAGVVASGNSLVGNTADDGVGYSGYSDYSVIAQNNGNYVVWSPTWDNGATVDAGAITLGFGNGTTTGAITAANSVRGTAAAGGIFMNFAYDALRAQLIVGRPASNIVSLLRPGAVTSASIVLDTPDPSDPGEVVTFVTTLTASPAPSQGSVRIEASTGETCTDNTPTVTSANTAEFSCQMPFATLGARSVRAEFLGTNSHGYSLSGPEPHAVAALFANGFE